MTNYLHHVTAPRWNLQKDGGHRPPEQNVENGSFSTLSEDAKGKVLESGSNDARTQTPMILRRECLKYITKPLYDINIVRSPLDGSVVLSKRLQEFSERFET